MSLYTSIYKDDRKKEERESETERERQKEREGEQPEASRAQQNRPGHERMGTGVGGRSDTGARKGQELRTKREAERTERTKTAHGPNGWSFI